MTNNDSFKTKDQFTIKNKQYTFFNIGRAEKNGLGNVDELPYCLRVLLENALRKEDGKNVKKDQFKLQSMGNLNCHSELLKIMM